MTQSSIECPHCHKSLDGFISEGNERIVCPSCGGTIEAHDPVDLPPDSVIGGCRIIRKIGQGGMGVVYLAEQLSLRRQVAFKVLKTPSGAENFVREARAAARINHPNIVGVYDVAEVDGISFIIMEYVTGVSLRRLLRRGGRMPVPRAVVFGRQILSALARAHHDGLIHKDIKPGNILVDPDGIVKVADFGLAEVHEQADAANAAHASREMRRVRSGTPGYASPEQIRGEPCDARSDLYSAGATLYCMLAGQPPFAGETRDEVLAKVETDNVADLVALNPEVPTHLGALVGRMLSRSPEDRPGNADEVLRELESVVQELGINERHVFGAHDWHRLYSDALSGERKGFLRRVLWSLAVAAAVVVLLVIGYALDWGHSGPAVGVEPGTEPSTATTPPTTVLTPEERGRALFELATKYAEERPGDYATIISNFQEVVLTAPGTEYSLRARREISAAEESRREAGERLLNSVKRAANALVEDERFQEAIETCRIPPAFAGGEFEADVVRLREEIRGKGMARIRELEQEIKRLTDRDDFDGARARLKVLVGIGLEEAPNRAVALRRAIDMRQRQVQDVWAYDAHVEYFSILEKSDEFAAERKYDSALRHVSSYADRREYQAIREDLDLELNGLRVAEGVYKTAVKYLRENPGVEVRVKGIAGTLIEVRNGVAVVKTGAGESTQNVTEISGREIARLAEVASGASSPESALRSGVFLLYDHRFREADREFKTAGEAGLDTDFYLRRLALASEDGWETAKSPAIARRGLYRMRQARRQRDWQEVLKQVFELRQLRAESVVTENRSEINRVASEAERALKSLGR